MSWKFTTTSLFIAALALSGVRTQMPPPTATVPPGAPAGLPPGYQQPTVTTSPKHPFCTHPPLAETPKIPIFHMDVRTGFPDGYRQNQTVIVEITAKYPEIWRIQQVFIHVPDLTPIPVHAQRAHDPRYHHEPKEVGKWAWTLKSSTAGGGEIGGTEPVDCGGMSNYGPFGMLTTMGAHAAKQTPPLNNDPMNPHKGWNTTIAKWVPPSDWQSIIYRRTITIEAFVTFETMPPTDNPFGHYPPPGYQPPRQARWVKLTATIQNRDFVDIHNYLIMQFGPNYQQFFGPPKPVRVAAAAEL